jgi:hypothetical protein
MKIETFCFFIKKNFGGSFEKRFSETSNDFSYIYDSQDLGSFVFIYKNESIVECNNSFFDMSFNPTEEEIVDYFISLVGDEKARRLLR